MGASNPEYMNLSDVDMDMYPHSTFDYSVWTAGTALVLANVPWDAQYREVVWFSSDASLNNWLANGSTKSHTLKRMTYVPQGEPVRVNIPFNTCNRFNYVRVANPSQPVRQGETRRDFYYFILDVNYVAPNTTELVLQLDVWQTYIRQTRFAKAFCERGHIGISKTYNASTEGNTGYYRGMLAEPEGFDLGGQYRIAKGWSYDVFKTRGKAYNYGVCVISTTDLTAPGSEDSPRVNMASGGRADNLVSGANIYYCTSPAAFTNMMSKIRKYPWTVQGIVGVYAMPHLTISNKESDGKDAWGIDESKKLGPGVWKIINTRDKFGRPDRWTIPNFRSHNPIVKGRYRYLKKFHTYPYTVLEMTAYNGSSTILRPENIVAKDLAINVLTHAFPPGQRIAAYPAQAGKYGVRTDNTGNRTVDLGTNDTNNARVGEFLANAVVISEFPQLPVVNDQAGVLLASTMRSRQYEYKSADWSQQRAMMQAQTAKENAGTQIAASTSMANNSMWAAGQSAGVSNQMANRRADLQNLNTGVGTVAGVAGSLLSGSLGGVVSSLAQGGMSAINTSVERGMAIDQTNANLAIQNQLTSRNLAAQNKASRSIADANYSLAQRAASGDYANTIAGINAKVQDIEMTPPAMQSTYGGESFNLSMMGGEYIFLKMKTITEGPTRAIGEYWLRYGYAVNRWVKFPSNFLVANHFTYWKCQNVTIKESFAPQQFREALRGILERGTTVWNHPDNINNIDWADNNFSTGPGTLYWAN